MQIIWQPLINLLIIFYHLFFNNLGLAIIALTVFIRLVLMPLTVPSLKAMQKMRDLAPELERMKKKFTGDKKKLMQAQADFYKAKGINPASGCLPQIIQIVILIALFRGFINVLSVNGDVTEKLNQVLYPQLTITGEVNTLFFGLDLTKPDVIRTEVFPIPLPGVILVFSALVQFVSSKMMLPIAQKAQKAAKKTPGAMDDFMTAMNKQGVYLFPLLTLWIGYTFPSGLVLYWATFSLFQAVQQYFMSGWGGLKPWISKLESVKIG